MNPNARKPGESFEAYRKRLKAMHVVERVHRKGRLVWDSKTDGTFRRAKQTNERNEHG